ncbi:hypothetical protein NL108_014162 [Boleophthalmus pectinirostris]|uniref:uncharacterized protein LOC129409845 isoform X2 n=1 Tax=Boleophthalmus pectinirostris TaxID=150288 RepID=UPI002432C09D|nr:uncharacterized protein LOC129409845 isoform X2 [Boleophthalmus pectinirostris]KAJ0055874.1 hypothetical protein NL108_014162 [Boleophthalmus pectinirostris]
MKIAFTFVLFLVLWSGRPGFTREIDVFEVKEGDDFRKKYVFQKYGNWKYFCRNDCEKENILIKTFSNEEDNGRYRIEFKKRFFDPSEMYVSIRNVTLSDTGTYSCGLETWHEYKLVYLHVDFIINVSSVVRSNHSPGVLSPETHSEPHEDHTPLSRAPDIPVYAQIQESPCVYEEVAVDNRQSRRAVEEPSYTTHSYNIYSLCSGPVGPQMADSSSTLTYTQVDFSKHSSAPWCPTATTEEAPVYSTLCLPHSE